MTQMKQWLPVGLGLLLVVLIVAFPKLSFIQLGPYYGKKIDHPISNFSLLDSKGNEFSLFNLKGKYSFLFFGFTKCNGVCPKNLGIFTELSKKEDLAEARFIFVSIDPRDTVSEVDEYVGLFSGSFLGLLSGRSQALDLAKSFGAQIYIDSEKLKKKRNEQINHAGFIYLIHPNGNLFLAYPYQEVDSDRLTDDFRKVRG